MFLGVGEILIESYWLQFLYFFIHWYCKNSWTKTLYKCREEHFDFNGLFDESNRTLVFKVIFRIHGIEEFDSVIFSFCFTSILTIKPYLPPQPLQHTHACAHTHTSIQGFLKRVCEVNSWLTCSTGMLLPESKNILLKSSLSPTFTN